MLEQVIYQYANNPEHYLTNYELAREYDKINQFASAVSFYIRAAEKSSDIDITYNSLVLAALCFEKQSRRKFTVEGLLQHAITICPARPEAHFHLCRLYEQMKEWRKMLVHAETGILLDKNETSELLEYPGKIGLKFYSAFGTYQIGLFDKGKKDFMNLVHFNSEDSVYKTIANNNLTNLGYPDIIAYEADLMKDRFKFPFNGFESIETNYSKHFQDMFVLSILNGKRNGYYLEFGAGFPFLTNNTALLETQFDWKGLSFDKDESICYDFVENRRNPILMADVLKLDLQKTFIEHCVPSFVDYLQIDCNEDSLELLTKLPFDLYEFGIIQFEHDVYRISPDVKSNSEKFLSSKGYIKLVNNVAFNQNQAYEDWWVHPTVYNREFESTKDLNFILDYMLHIEK